jgi:hypothetical protein
MRCKDLYEVATAPYLSCGLEHINWKASGKRIRPSRCSKTTGA